MNFKIREIHEFYRHFKMPTNFKHKIRSVTLHIIYELYHITKSCNQVLGPILVASDSKDHKSKFTVMGYRTFLY